MPRNVNIKAHVISAEVEAAETETIMKVVRENYLPVEQVRVQTPFTIIKLENEDVGQTPPADGKPADLWCKTIVLLGYSNATPPKISLIQIGISDNCEISFQTPEDGEGFIRNEVNISLDPPLIRINNGRWGGVDYGRGAPAGMNCIRQNNGSSGIIRNDSNLTSDAEMPDYAKTGTGHFQIADSMLVCTSPQLFQQLKQKQPNLLPQQVLIQRVQEIVPQRLEIAAPIAIPA